MLQKLPSCSKEIWTNVLAYSLIRTFMAQAAIRHEVLPRTISFKGTLQILAAFPTGDRLPWLRQQVILGRFHMIACWKQS
ncbi:MAG: hypothetical protein U0992_18900 [Planctomycetaceae bacterium]